MTLSKEETRLFFKLYLPLIGYANQYDGKKDERPLNKARDILYEHPKIIGDFLTRNPEKFNQEELGIIALWQRFIKGNFILIKSFKKYGVLLSMGSGKAKAYGVVGLTQSVIDMAEYGIGTYFERVALLPWKDKIIWDGLCYVKPVIMGKNYMHSFIEEYKNIERAGRILEHF